MQDSGRTWHSEQQFQDTAVIEVFAKDGIKVGETSIELKAGHRISRLISELIPSIENLMGGSIRITSTRPIIGQQFFGDRSKNYLSSVPPVY